MNLADLTVLTQNFGALSGRLVPHSDDIRGRPQFRWNKKRRRKVKQMSPQQRRWFDALTQDRTENANTLEKPSMRGVQRSVVDKYSDQAHFIYELLQNADDARATAASFVLERDGLVFRHDGETRFSISDPATEDADSASGALGHVNAITSIANSNKTAASIGKFGVRSPTRMRHAIGGFSPRSPRP